MLHYDALYGSNTERDLDSLHDHLLTTIILNCDNADLESVSRACDVLLPRLANNSYAVWDSYISLGDTSTYSGVIAFLRYVISSADTSLKESLVKRPVHFNKPKSGTAGEDLPNVLQGMLIACCKRQTAFGPAIDSALGDFTDDGILLGVGGAMFDVNLLDESVRDLSSECVNPRFLEYTAYRVITRYIQGNTGRWGRSGPGSVKCVAEAAARWFLLEYGHLVPGGRGRPWRTVRRAAGELSWAVRNILGHIEGFPKSKSTPFAECKRWDNRLAFGVGKGPKASWDNMLHWSVRITLESEDGHGVLAEHARRCLSSHGSIPSDTAISLMECGVTDSDLLSACQQSAEEELSVLREFDLPSSIAMVAWMNSRSSGRAVSDHDMYICYAGVACGERLGRKSKDTVGENLAETYLTSMYRITGASVDDIARIIRHDLSHSCTPVSLRVCADAAGVCGVCLHGTDEGPVDIDGSSLRSAVRESRSSHDRLNLARLVELSGNDSAISEIVLGREALGTRYFEFPSNGVFTSAVSAACVYLSLWMSVNTAARTSVLMSYRNHEDTMGSPLAEVLAVCESLTGEN